MQLHPQSAVRLNGSRRLAESICQPTLRRWNLTVSLHCGIPLTADFGHHNYDLKSKLEKGHHKGQYHTEFAPA